MKKLSEWVTCISGSPQFRIAETRDEKAPKFTYYGQTDLMDDLAGMVSAATDAKQVRTHDEIQTVHTGDILFSLITGDAALAGCTHEGYLYTQNYVKLVPKKELDAGFLVYILNEDKSIQKQLRIGLQGSHVLKYTLQQLKELHITDLPDLERQQRIGNVYLKQQKLRALRERAAALEMMIGLAKLEEAAKQ